MDYKEAFLELIETCRTEEDSEDDPSLTKAILEILDKLDKPEDAIQIAAGMSKFELAEESITPNKAAVLCCIEYLERKALEAVASQKPKTQSS